MGFIKLNEIKDTGKTKVFEVLNSLSDLKIGIIKYYPGFRKYCFYPDANTLYDSKCMHELSETLAQLQEERKNGST